MWTRIAVPSPSGSRSLLGFPDPEEESTTFLKLLVNYTSSDTTWYPRRLKFATAPLREPQILQHLFVITIELEAKENVHTAVTLHYLSIYLPHYIICPYSCHVTLCVHTAAMLHYVSIHLPCYTCTYTYIYAYILWIHKCVIKTAGCGTSHKHTNIQMYSVQYYKKIHLTTHPALQSVCMSFSQGI